MNFRNDTEAVLSSCPMMDRADVQNIAQVPGLQLHGRCGLDMG